jgi:hypothetical protein
MNYKHLYSELGKLLYAVADVDGVITKQEKEALIKIIKTGLAPAENQRDQFGTNVANYTEIEFDFLDEQIIEPEVAFNSFIDFIEEHQTGIDEKMKKVFVQVAEALGKAYHGTNKKEKKLVDKLKSVLKRVEFKKSKTTKKKNEKIND